MQVFTLALVALSVVAEIAQAPPPTAAGVPPDQFFDSSGVRIRFVEEGQGSPVVLLHGYTGTLERHWINPSVDAMRELAPVMPALKLVVIDGAEHGGERGILRRPEFLRTLHEFLAAHR